ncbi:MAG: hypothetical protein HRT61_04050 [Ekhidna sp.]|nr:hypothetical protein [Ekhidna sp.]
MIEVFKTDIHEASEASWIDLLLRSSYKLKHISFDLEDCDRILRVESDKIDADQIVEKLTGLGIQCSILPD